jgi:hypothetical protein
MGGLFKFSFFLLYPIIKQNKMANKAKTKTVYIVKYNDRYGNGDDTSIEAVLEKESDFKKWLKMHNDSRDAEPESEEEFDVDSIQMVIFE